ncbi:MAG TPA: metal-sensitive transcriptional regulator [Thermodesulfobacteriota bacterium]|nr:metal-sensitive transcriptional regulator [Thermodesulfobacteriota bacterium]
MQGKERILRRLKSIEGHIRGIQKMVEDDRYCIDIIKQILAVKSAVDKVSAMILKGHLENCVTTAIRSNKQAERERVITEIIDVFETSGKI